MGHVVSTRPNLSHRPRFIPRNCASRSSSSCCWNRVGSGSGSALVLGSLGRQSGHKYRSLPVSLASFAFRANFGFGACVELTRLPHSPHTRTNVSASSTRKKLDALCESWMSPSTFLPRGKNDNVCFAVLRSDLLNSRWIYHPPSSKSHF